MRFMRRDLFYARYVYETASVLKRQAIWQLFLDPGDNLVP